MNNIILIIYLSFLFNIFFSTINAIPYKRYRRQLKPNTKAGLPYEGWSGGSNNPSGGIPGAYYGTGTNPNYGGVRPHQNTIEGGINVISYNHAYTHNGGSNANLNQHQQAQQQYYSSNNNNAWQRPDTNNYYNQPYNRYPVGSQGWYATGGNYWYNQGQTFIPHGWLLIICTIISIIYV